MNWLVRNFFYYLDKYRSCALYRWIESTPIPVFFHTLVFFIVFDIFGLILLAFLYLLKGIGLL